MVVCRFWGGGLLLLSCNAKQLFGISFCGLRWQKICGGKGMDWDKKKWEEVWEEKRKLEKRTKQNQQGYEKAVSVGDDGVEKRKVQRNGRKGTKGLEKKLKGKLIQEGWRNLFIPLWTSLQMLIKTLQWLGNCLNPIHQKKKFYFGITFSFVLCI